MALLSWRGLAAWAVALGAVTCVRSSANRPLPLGRASQVEFIDTLPTLSARLAASTDALPDGPMAAWVDYEHQHHQILDVGGGLEPDVNNHRLAALAMDPGGVATSLRTVSAELPGELNAVVNDLQARMGGAPHAVVALVALRTDLPTTHGEWSGHPVVLLNGRDPMLAESASRRALLVRELFVLWHQERFPTSASLGPVALRLYREGAALLAARQLVPQAQEPQVLGLPPTVLSKLRAHEALIAKELLASLETNRESEAARFFDRQVKDPLLPAGAGIYGADRLYGRLAAALGSATRPLELAPSDFLLLARKHLLALSTGKP